jgi:hypothetical protein
VKPAELEVEKSLPIVYRGVVCAGGGRGRGWGRGLGGAGSRRMVGSSAKVFGRREEPGRGT